MSSIKFYANYKNGKYFISGKNEQNKYFSLWKSQEFNNELYLDNEKFKKGLEIEKSKLRLLKDEEHAESKVLVFKEAEEEKKYCIDKAEIEKRKQEAQQKKNNKDKEIKQYIISLFKSFIETNEGFNVDGVLKNEIEKFNNTTDTNEDDLEF